MTKITINIHTMGQRAQNYARLSNKALSLQITIMLELLQGSISEAVRLTQKRKTNGVIWLKQRERIVTKFHSSIRGSRKTVTEQSVNFPHATLWYKPPDDQAKFNNLSPIPIWHRTCHQCFVSMFIFQKYSYIQSEL